MTKFVITLLLCFYFSLLQAQTITEKKEGSIQLPEKYLDKVSSQSNSLQQKLDKKTKKALAQLQKQEARMKKKLSKTDSSAAKNIFAKADEKYKELEQRLKNPPFKQYIPGLDTVSTSLKFLQQNPALLNQTKEVKEKLADAMNKVKGLESQLQKAEDLKQFLKERRQFLKEQLSKFGFVKEFKQLNKQVYYYSQQLNEYKEILNDPKKIERKAIELLSKTKLFKDFMQKNSMLASLFRMPGDPNDPNYMASLAGLQTRASVQQTLISRFGTAAFSPPVGGAGGGQLQANLQQAQSQLQQLKDKVIKAGGGSSNAELPDFKPNNQKTKNFLQRLELGTNVQSQKSTNFFPVTSDIGLSLGYKLNDNSLIGIGASYKLGWGSGWNNINLSHQGVGLRSFIDWKLKGSFYISGGYEQNYKAEIRNIDQLNNYSAWQHSGLIGVSKVVSVKSKLFKKTKVQLLWDFLSYEQIPRGQSILFRVGYNFK
jgi:hypothetical protein